MTTEKNRTFSPKTMLDALARQNNRCGSCGVYIHALGKDGARGHVFGEWAEAHHIVHWKVSKDNSLSNCVVLCKSCHYSAHVGGFYRENSAWAQGSPRDFVRYNGARNPECRKLGAAMDQKFGRGEVT